MVIDRKSNDWKNNSVVVAVRAHVLLCMLVHNNAAPVAVIVLQTVFSWTHLTSASMVPARVSAHVST